MKENCLGKLVTENSLFVMKVNEDGLVELDMQLNVQKKQVKIEKNSKIIHQVLTSNCFFAFSSIENKRRSSYGPFTK